MSASTPVFLDESTLRFCPQTQILQIVEIEGYDYFIGEEVIHGVRHSECASRVVAQLTRGRVTPHRITRLDDIRLMTKIAKRCGACRGEVCSYVAAKRENGIVVAQDALAHELLASHIPGVTAVEPSGFLRGDHLVSAAVLAPLSEPYTQDLRQRPASRRVARVR